MVHRLFFKVKLYPFNNQNMDREIYFRIPMNPYIAEHKCLFYCISFKIGFKVFKTFSVSSQWQGKKISIHHFKDILKSIWKFFTADISFVFQRQNNELQKPVPLC